jgi:methionyl-tRNA formyltransferase
MNILFCAYRDWATQILSTLEISLKQHSFDLVTQANKVNEALTEKAYDLIFFIGWSWLVEEDIIDRYFCVCLHPSPLPKYRGGSPIQNQIINGETSGAVTLFRMDNLIDHGPIIFQEDIPLQGTLEEVFKRIEQVGARGITQIIDYYPNILQIPQNESEATYFKRREPKNSEITLFDLQNLSSVQIHNKVRCLQEPYPTPFIVCADGKKLYILETLIDD